MELRPYQKEAIKAIKQGWNEHQKELLVLPTGTGKTVVFSQIAHDESKNGRVLIMAHRDELIEQARAKYTSLTGDATAKEKASDTCIGSSERVVVGSVQTMQRDRRLSRFSHDYFDTIIVDEAHNFGAENLRLMLNPKIEFRLALSATLERHGDPAGGRVA